MTFLASINGFLDALPRPRLSALGRQVPAFRTCGVVGYYISLIILMAAGLLTGRSLTVLAVIALVSALSFYGYAYLRRLVTGHEELVLLEQVWVALACNAGALYLMSVPVLAYLDLFCVALCPFLAAGRVGCTLVGCCHGNPSAFGITYNDSCVRDGFSPHLIGIRLFPVPVIEAAGLLVIGMTGCLALPFAAPGKVLTWYLLAYAIMRFGLEGLRADDRPHFLGLSQARWMAIIEAGLALELVRTGQRSGASLLFYPLAFGLLIAILAIRWRRNWRRRLLVPRHWREVRELARATIETDAFASMTIPARVFTAQNVLLAVSLAKSGRLWSRNTHISISLPKSHSDLRLLCELAARAFPELIIESAQFTNVRVLHLITPTPLAAIAAGPQTKSNLGKQLYGSLVRKMQTPQKTPALRRNGEQRVGEAPAQLIVPARFADDRPAIEGKPSVTSAWYFNRGTNKTG